MKEITPVEAWALLDEAPDALLVDVRSQGEFAAGHPAGALNVPIADADPRTGGMAPNPEFLDAMKALVPVEPAPQGDLPDRPVESVLSPSSAPRPIRPSGAA